MIQPIEMKLELPMKVYNDTATTSKVWAMLIASHNGQVDKVKALAAECPGLLYAQYNYTPPFTWPYGKGIQL
ncbi:hypothetical protein [Paraflavitalea speifideaquila]|uniref:hypothetical protein n=1 Tax=Paraflavitalea speifideaquila TaxID=3076558 RepID=UPI0028EDF38F|nr:hypothetical protein [Paraflavitalea speifideiaquila]